LASAGCEDDHAGMEIPPHRRTPGAVEDPAPGLTRRERRQLVEPVAGAQLGLISRRQLRDRGWSAHQIEHEIGFGRWTAPSGLVVACQSGPLSAEQRLWLGVLHAGSGSALTHITAAECAGLSWKRPDDVVHVLTDKGDLVPGLTGFFFHQSRRPFRRWTDDAGTPPRLRIEHAVCLAAERDRSVRRAIGLLAATVQQGLSTPERLDATMVEIRKLRHGAQFKLALGDIAGGAHSFAEIDIGRVCEEAGLRPPDRQRIRLDKTGRRRFLDCEWILPNGEIVVLEIDGSFHMNVANWTRDMKRERSVVISGRTVLRCSSVEIRLEPEDIVEDLRLIGIPPATAPAA
jgi:hypothetical protein